MELRLLRLKEHSMTRVCLQESVIVKTAGNDIENESDLYFFYLGTIFALGDTPPE